MHQIYTFIPNFFPFAMAPGDMNFTIVCLLLLQVLYTKYGKTWEDGWTDDNGRQIIAKGHLSHSYVSCVLCYMYKH